MAIADNKKQKDLIAKLLASPDVYTRTASIIKPEYFQDQVISGAVEFIQEYFSKYSKVPPVDTLNIEFDGLDLKDIEKIPRDQVEYACDEWEKYCREVATRQAILNSIDDIENHEMSKVLPRIAEAVQISLQRDMGIEVFEDPEARLTSLIEAYTPIPCGINSLDALLGGGLVRTQFTLFSANSGGGKSLMLANIGANYAQAGYDVVYISLELEDSMIFLRLAAILSGLDASNWKAHIPEISAGILKHSKDSGSYLLKRLPQGTTATDIRSYLSYYEMEYGKRPDVILVDYLDLMHPNGGIKNVGVFEQDKQKSEELVEILHDYNAIGISASQQNREALTSGPSQAGIAGGISKVNTVDNYISLVMNETMRLEGEMNAYFLKTRSANSVGQVRVLDFNPFNLRIGDPKDASETGVMPRKRKDNGPSVADLIEEINPTKQMVTGDIDGLPGVNKPEANELPEELFEEEKELPLVPSMPKLRTSDGGESLLDMMEKLRG